MLETEKEFLINSHISLAKNLAKKKKRNTRRSIYYEELESAAFAGLVDAALRHEKSKGPFGQYATWRINGEMEDYIRELSWSRYTPVKINRIDRTYSCEEEQDNRFDEILKFLPSLGKQMFKWYYQDGLTFKEIGKRINASESSVSLQMKDFRNSLRKKRNEILN